MTEQDFVNAITSPHEDYHKVKREHYSILFAVADRQSNGRLSFQDWAAFENLLHKPDAEYEIVFRLFDTQGKGLVTFEDFKKLHDEHRTTGLPFDWNSQWANLYLGEDGNRHDLSYPEFTQMVRGLQEEKIRQAFKFYDKSKTGYIEPEQFQKIVEDTTRHKLSDHLLSNLFMLCNVSVGSKISYAHVRAFQNVIRELDMVEAIVRSATTNAPDGKITKTDFLNEATKLTRFSMFTPMEADIIFLFAGLDNPTSRLGVSDFASILDSSIEPTNALHSPVPGLPLPRQGSGSLLTQIAQSAYNFGLGSIAGAFGATVVYPIDLVKTRMQNQRSKVVGELMYKNSIDCAKKVIRNEGIKGLYSGLGPQLLGVAPEKAIKLTVNDLVRSKAPRNEKGEIPLFWELIAGGSAGGCQVVSHLCAQ